MAGRRLRDDIETVLVTAEQIEAAVKDVASQLTDDVGEREPIFIGVLTGAFVFLADLIRQLDFPVEVCFVAASSYGDSTIAGDLEVTADIDREITGRHVVIVDDIIDTGETLRLLTQMMQQRGAASVRTCCLLDKPERRSCDFEADYVGITIPDSFVVGYGLDFAEEYRNLPFVGVLRPELYNPA